MGHGRWRITLKIDAALAERLKACRSLGQSVEEYAFAFLTPVDAARLPKKRSHWDEVRRDLRRSDRTRDGGIPLEDVERWVRPGAPTPSFLHRSRDRASAE
jgi:hypothetical protein